MPASVPPADNSFNQPNTCVGYAYEIYLEVTSSSGVITPIFSPHYCAGGIQIIYDIYNLNQTDGYKCKRVLIKSGIGTNEPQTFNPFLGECSISADNCHISKLEITNLSGLPDNCNDLDDNGGGGGTDPEPPPPPEDDDLMPCCDQVVADLEFLKAQVKEIHQSLQATKYAQDDDVPGQARVANLGYFIERIARVLGISVKSNGQILGIRQQKTVKPGQPIPGGWNFGQWGLNKGSSSEGQQGGNANEFRDGIVYEQRSNQAEVSQFNPAGGIVKISRGNYVLCENIPQLLDAFWDDLDKALGMQELGASAIPNADNSGKFCTYEGLAKLLTEIAYMNSRISQHTAQTQICSMITQALANEILRSTGQPLEPKSFPIGLGGGELAAVPYLGLASDAPSSVEQWVSVMQTLAPILAAHLKTLTDKDGVSIADGT